MTPPARRNFTGAILLGLLVAAIALHILVDQFTPYSSEATVQAPVIGVASNVSRTIVEVSVEDNPVLPANEPLFTIDPERFAAAVASAAIVVNIPLAFLIRRARVTRRWRCRCSRPWPISPAWAVRRPSSPGSWILGHGLTLLVSPTNVVVVGGLAIGGVGYDKYLRFM